MIRNETEYQEANRRLVEERERLAMLRDRLREEGKSTSEIKRVTDPIKSFQLQLAEEVESYECLRRGQFSERENAVPSGLSCPGLSVKPEGTEQTQH
jgi:hypothetical protein